MEMINFNPGLVPNATDGMSCALACGQMLMRTRPGERIPSFEDFDRITHRRRGEYSWVYGLLSYFAIEGFEVRAISSFDLTRFCDEGQTYIFEFFGAEAAQKHIDNMNLECAIERTKALLIEPTIDVQNRVPILADVRKLISDGFYLIPYVNQRILQADPGYVAHTLFVYGFSDRGVRTHNPGPPATEATEIAWELFEKAWSSPNDGSRILLAAKPKVSILAS